MGKIVGFYVMPHPPILIPEVGRGEERKIQQTFQACQQIGQEIRDLAPETIIIVTPHGPLFQDGVAFSYSDYIAGDLDQFNAPQVRIKLPIDQDLTEEIIFRAEKNNITTIKIDEATAQEYQVPLRLDHGSLIPLYFIAPSEKPFKLVHITYGLLPKLKLYQLGMEIKKAVEEGGSKVVFIASGDLSHRLTPDGPYPFSPQGKIFDKTILNLLQTGDVPGILNLDPSLIQEAGECGLRSFYMMLGAMDGNKIAGELLSYQGTFGVGYGVMKFNLKPNSSSVYQESKTYLDLARASLKYYLQQGEYLPLPENLPSKMLEQKRGVFVSLKKEGALRGCIGTIFPVTENVATEIIRNAVAAGTRDPRFYPVNLEELAELDVSVDVLTEPEETTLEKLDPKKYGIIVQKGSRVGVLLPDLEGVDTVEEQLSIALEKGSIGHWEDYKIERFSVRRYS